MKNRQIQIFKLHAGCPKRMMIGCVTSRELQYISDNMTCWCEIFGIYEIRINGRGSEQKCNFVIQKDSYYRVSQVVIALGLADFDLDATPSCPAAQPLLPIFHSPTQNQTDSGTIKIQDNQNKFTTTWDALQLLACRPLNHRFRIGSL